MDNYEGTPVHYYSDTIISNDTNSLLEISSYQQWAIVI